jgi:transposase
MTAPPNDIDQSKAKLLELQQQNEVKDKLLAEKQEEVVELKTKIQLLVEQLNLNKSKRYASQSEKTPKGAFNEAE